MGNKLRLSARLKAIASFVPERTACADIGADHGLLAQYLLDTGRAARCFASDNKIGPYRRLKANLKTAIAEGKAEVSLSDGLKELPPDYPFVILAGMGGDLMISIVETSSEKLSSIDYFLLSPQSKEEEVRRRITALGYRIVDESVVFDGHFYPILLFGKGSKTYDDRQYRYGPVNLIRREETFLRLYREKIGAYRRLLENENLSPARRKEIEEEIRRDRAMLDDCSEERI